MHVGGDGCHQLDEAVRRIHAVKVPVDYVPSACTPARSSTTTPDKPAIIMGGSGFTQTFAELDAAANRLSHLLRAAGVQPGDHVALCMENHDRYMEVAVGLPLRRRRLHRVLQPPHQR